MRAINKADIIAVLAVVFIIAASYCAVMAVGESGSTVVVRFGDKAEEYSLVSDTIIDIKENGGNNIIEIKDGAVRMTDSDCPDKICMSGSISRVGEVIICLPNRVVVSVEGKGEYDAVSE